MKGANKMLDENFPYYVLVFILSFILTALLEKNLIPTLRKFARQPIYEEGPAWHSIKSGTPTMGGLAFLISIILALSATAVFLFMKSDYTSAVSMIITVVFTSLNATIGIIDDTAKLKRGKNDGGLTAKQKLIFHFLLALSFVISRKFLLGDTTEIAFSFGSIDIGFIYYPISIFIIVGIINSANLTDGIDGLASGVAFSVGVSLFYIACALSIEVSFISSAIIGASIAFLIFNLHPAKVFMGDTGSLFFGSLAVSAVFALDNPFLIILIGGVYVIEGISVIIQVLYYKKTKKRLFKMAPLHHHLEKSGWSENTICIVAILLTFILSIPAYILYLP